jgi:hypothetical protein
MRMRFGDGRGGLIKLEEGGPMMGVFGMRYLGFGRKSVGLSTIKTTS